jgi:hypothetical protein
VAGDRSGTLPPARPGVKMRTNEQTRHEMYLRLEEVLGTEAAASLMEHLPPVGWADVATKRDLDSLQDATRQDIALLRADLESTGHGLRADFRSDLNAAITSQTRTLMFAIIGSNVTMAALAFAAAAHH